NVSVVCIGRVIFRELRTLEFTSRFNRVNYLKKSRRGRERLSQPQRGAILKENPQGGEWRSAFIGTCRIFINSSNVLGRWSQGSARESSYVPFSPMHY